MCTCTCYWCISVFLIGIFFSDRRSKRRRIYDDKVGQWVNGRAALVQLQRTAFENRQQQELDFRKEEHEKKMELELEILSLKREEQEEKMEANRKKAALEIELLQLQVEQIKRQL